MKKNLAIIIITLIMLSSAFASSPVALTLRMRGDISLTRAEQQSRLNEGLPLLNQDKLTSGDGSFAFLKFVDDSATMKLFANSIMTINTEKSGEQLDKSSYLQVGNVFSSVNRSRGEYKIETPTTVASVRGTEGFVSVEADGTTLIVTLRGEFEMYNKESGRTEIIRAGNTGTSTSTGEIDVYVTQNIDPSWLEGLDEMPTPEGNTLRIQVIDQNGEIKTIEIELE